AGDDGLSLDAPASSIGLSAVELGLSDKAMISDVLRQLEHRLDKPDSPESRSPSWKKFTDALFYWDAKIQDKLTLQPTLSAAYQLGRGLAETSWALDPANAEAEDDWRSWVFLFGAG